ncbi:MAG: efflux RND transporter periplasmic adaptor subunit [Sulfuricurvum sp.]|nr:efflux RND transporter periplasmic adaptor subunit [Sulfuricurvum sp.]
MRIKELFIGIVFILIVSGCKEDSGAKDKENRPAVVSLMTLTKQQVELPVEFTGLSVASRPVQIRARVEGYLQSRHYREGSFVKAGQTLFTIDQKPFRLDVASVEAALDSEIGKKENTAQTLKRVRNLYEQKASGQQDLDAAITADRTQGSLVNQAKVALEQAKLNLSYTTISAPISGWADKVTQYEGSYIVPSQNGLLTTMYQTNPLFIDFSVNVSTMEMIKNLKSNPQNNEIVVDVILSDGSIYPNKGKISFISPTVDSVTGTRMLRAEIINPKGELAPGEFMKIRIRGLKQERIVIPDKALMQGPKGTFVYVVGAKKIAESRLVKVGNWINHDVVILEGLKEGEKIVCEGNARVDAGKVVKIASDQSTK